MRDGLGLLEGNTAGPIAFGALLQEKLG